MGTPHAAPGVLEDGEGVLASELTRVIRNIRKQEKKAQLLHTVSKELDIRDRWLGIRQMKKGYCAMPYA
eukprot:12226006-Prorocentrum_lima.AAC.1